MGETVHASCVHWEGQGILLVGASGSGKSTLAWRLIHEFHAELVGDDQLLLSAEAGHVVARPRLPGLIEMRGLGVIRRRHLQKTALAVAVDLEHPPSRLAEPSFLTLCGIDIPRVALPGHDPLAPLRVVMAAQTIGRHGFSKIGEYDIES